MQRERESRANFISRWDWSSVRRILIVRLRSIGDTVLATPSLFALRRFVPQAKIDILLEDWVAPVLDGSDLIDHVITIPRHSNAARARVARELHLAMGLVKRAQDSHRSPPVDRRYSSGDAFIVRTEKVCAAGKDRHPPGRLGRASARWIGPDRSRHHNSAS